MNEKPKRKDNDEGNFDPLPKLDIVDKPQEVLRGLITCGFIAQAQAYMLKLILEGKSTMELETQFTKGCQQYIFDSAAKATQSLNLIANAFETVPQTR